MHVQINSLCSSNTISCVGLQDSDQIALRWRALSRNSPLN